MEIDPWSNRLIENYDKLYSEFGMKQIDEKISAKLKKNRYFRRGLVAGQRDFDLWLAAAEKGQKVAAMSGIKPSGEFHMGSKMTAEELIFLQRDFGAKVFYSIADLEANADNGLTLEEGLRNAVSNVADMLALGLDEKNSYIWLQSRETRVTNFAYLAARRTTLATMHALYGEKNLGLYFCTLTQAGDIVLPQHPDFGGKKHVVVPVGFDQDPHLRLTRDLAAKFDLIAPSSTYHVFMRSLDGNEKMSKRDPMNLLTLSDEPELAKKKVSRAFTGGRATVEEQRRIGAEYHKCVVAELENFHFEEDDKKVEERKGKCLTGAILCGECKKEVCEKIVNYLKAHQERKKKLVSKAEKLLSKE